MFVVRGRRELVHFLSVTCRFSPGAILKEGWLSARHFLIRDGREMKKELMCHIRRRQQRLE